MTRLSKNTCCCADADSIRVAKNSHHNLFFIIPITSTPQIHPTTQLCPSLLKTMYGCFLLHFISTPYSPPPGGKIALSLGPGFTSVGGRVFTLGEIFSARQRRRYAAVTSTQTRTQCLVSTARVIPLSAYSPALLVLLPLFTFALLAGLRPRVVLRHGQGDHVPWRQRRRGTQAVGPRLRLYDQLYVCEQRSGE